MGIYKYMREVWKKPKSSENYKARLMQFRRENSTVRVERPTRIDRARSLGYKAKKGIVVVRQRVRRSKRMRSSDRAGRRPKANRLKMVLDMNFQQVAERRANTSYKNMEVLGSYEVAKDGQNYWYEVILADPNSPEIKTDKNLKWICDKKHTGRVYRGLTSAGRKSRGLRNKGKGAEKVRG